MRAADKEELVDHVDQCTAGECEEQDRCGRRGPELTDEGTDEGRSTGDQPQAVEERVTRFGPADGAAMPDPSAIL